MNREQRRRRVIITVSIAIAIAALGYLAFGGIGTNLVYYWSPSELIDAGDNALGADVRLGGLVAPGSIERGADGLTLEFTVTDGEQQVPVYARAVPPAMFREGIGVVVEGTIGTDGVFQTKRLMVKHDNQYRAPGEGEEADIEELAKSMQFDSP